MSTILYEDEKFLRIYETMKCARDGRDFACVFGYPDGWGKPGGMDTTLHEFVDKLRQANIQAYNERYEEGEPPISLLDFTNAVMPYGSTIQLLKSLHGLRYNIDSQDVGECAKQLDKVIDQLQYEIISRLPEWEKASTW